MGSHPTGTRRKRYSLLKMAPAMVLAALSVAVVAPPLMAQSAAGQAPTGQSPAAQSPAAQSPGEQISKMPDWQIAAGGKMQFDVASVKQDTSDQQTANANMPLGPMDLFTPTGGLFSATNLPLSAYINFAYKLTGAQGQAVMSQLPKWANTDRYDIQARGTANTTKNQFRLMMQAMLADRFKLAIHRETKQLPVLALVLDKPGKLGPHMQLHPDDSTCVYNTTPNSAGQPPTVAGGFPEGCGGLGTWPSNTPGRYRTGGRNVSMAMIASNLITPFSGSGVDRPILDKTGLTGKYDLVMEYTPQFNGPLPPSSTFQPDESGPTFLQALKDDLGLKLESQTGPVDVIVVDHVEQPSQN